VAGIPEHHGRAIHYCSEFDNNFLMLIKLEIKTKLLNSNRNLTPETPLSAG
jgi:hypothetical protein